jgi:hypothetical membrane protein
LTGSRNIYQRTGAASGLLAPIVAFIFIFIAIASYPQFNWANNALSDLGIKPGITGPLFNFGLFASGLLVFNFAIFGLFTYFGKNWVGKTGSAVFAAATLALMAIGVFNENFSPTHYFVSVAFFVLAPISLLILAGVFVLAQHKRVAFFTVAVGVVAVSPWLLLFVFNYVPNVAIPEFISGLAISMWVIVISIKMLKT